MATTVVHCKRLPFDIYIGRPSELGNPFSHKDGTQAKYKVTTREEAVAKYEDHLLSRLDLMIKLNKCKGKILGCWCSPLACHGDIIAKFAEMDNLIIYCKLMNERLSARRLGGLQEVEDKILEEMDVAWHRMSEDERKYAEKVSKSVNW
jgi:hypothetical protein